MHHMASPSSLETQASAPAHRTAHDPRDAPDRPAVRSTTPLLSGSAATASSISKAPSPNGSTCSALASNATCARPAPTPGSTNRRARRATSSAITATGRAFPEYRDFVLHSHAAETGRPTHEFHHREVLPRARAGEGAAHRVAHAVAPRPALLLHRRDADRELLDPARSRAALDVPGVGRGVPPVGEVVPAEEVHRHRLRARG